MSEFINKWKVKKQQFDNQLLYESLIKIEEIARNLGATSFHLRGDSYAFYNATQRFDNIEIVEIIAILGHYHVVTGENILGSWTAAKGWSSTSGTRNVDEETFELEKDKMLKKLQEVRAKLNNTELKPREFRGTLQGISDQVAKIDGILDVVASDLDEVIDELTRGNS